MTDLPLQNVPDRASKLTIAAVLAMAILIAATVYFLILRVMLASDLRTQTEETVKAHSEIALLEQEQVGAVKTAEGALNEIQTRERAWSEVMRTITLAVPRHLKTDVPKAGFQSYSGTEEGMMTLFGATQPGSPDPYRDLADTVRAFTEIGAFDRVFVPNLSRGINEKGQIILSFTLTMTLK